MMVVPSEWLREKVGDIRSRGNLFVYNRLRLDELLNIMMTNVDMFHLTVILGILCKCNRPPTIPLNYPRHLMLNHNFVQPRLHPDHLLGAPGHSDVLRLDCGKCNSGLPLTAPGN